MVSQKATVKVSPKAIKLIAEARKAGESLRFVPAIEGGPVCVYMPARHEIVEIYADGGVAFHYTGEDSGVEAAIEADLDARCERDPRDYF